MKTTLALSVLCALLWALPAEAQTITAAAVGSRTTGCVAPCAVFFDASGSTHSVLGPEDEFLDMHYVWDFDDGPCESGGDDIWSTNGKSKCSDYGPFAGHVYETPGSYTATVTVSYDGVSDNDSVTQVVVTDPDTVYAGSATTCIAQDTLPEAGVAGCPSGADVETNADFNDACGDPPAADTRYLFKRGDTFTADTRVRMNNSGIFIGAYGTGDKPIINSDDNAVFWLGEDGRVMDLDLHGTDDTGSGSYAYGTASTPDFGTVLRVDATDYIRTVILGGGSIEWGDLDNISIIDSTNSSKAYTESGNNEAWFHGAFELLFMGNDFGDSPGGEHTWRSSYTRNSVISHNELGPLNTDQVYSHDIRHLIKWHGSTGAVGAGAPACSGKSMVADNRLIGGIQGTLMWVGPQSDSQPTECVELLRIERNYFAHLQDVRLNTMDRSLAIQGKDIIARNNIFHMYAGAEAGGDRRYVQGINVSVRGNTDPDGVHLENNTFYVYGEYQSNSPYSMSDGSDQTAHNNLCYGADGQDCDGVGEDCVCGADTNSGNIEATANPFIDQTPDSVEDFIIDGELAVADDIIDQGDTLVMNVLDFAFSTRPSGAGYDIGAYEGEAEAAVCGDDVTDGAEACDDGNETGSDGCEADCLSVTTNWSCNTENEPSTCEECGDGNHGSDPVDACDDGDTSGSDGCSATCTVEADCSCNAAEPDLCNCDPDFANDTLDGCDENSVATTSCDTPNPATDVADGTVDTLTYSITSGNPGGDTFSIETDDGEILVDDNTLLDHETAASYVLVVRATDDGTPVRYAEANITVPVNDVNEAPVLTADTWAIDEDASDTDVVDTIDTYSDVDDGDTDAYTITAGNGDAIFAVDNDGVVTVDDNTNLDYETISQYVLTIEVEDSGALTDDADFTINIGDVGDEGGAVCGDGAVEGYEICDDDNSESGDGCGPSCRVERGYTCDGADPTVCTAVTGYVAPPDLLDTVRVGGCCPRSDVR